ncbi:hypothetical protein KFK09_019787 [Dendrobium nobile]|uniref:Uncharacterized protein n=1 Tax=Dendrobium nobile TaxID=94219 RepID=A0A8T3ARF3_DENNO|nr:hypothetical protein KFK09_019787 [Dendrobium nobile]
MFHSWVDPSEKRRLVVVLCGNASGRERPVGGDDMRYPFPDLASSGFLEARTLRNPTIDQFQDVLSAECPDILYFQGQQLESEEEIGSLMWGTTDVTDTEFFVSLIIPPLPSIVSKTAVEHDRGRTSQNWIMQSKETLNEKKERKADREKERDTKRENSCKPKKEVAEGLSCERGKKA